jgi:hypothetical protein
VNGVERVKDVLQLRQALYNELHYGPFALEVPPEWKDLLDDIYMPEYKNKRLTLRERLLRIDGIRAISVGEKLSVTEMSSGSPLAGR